MGVLQFPTSIPATVGVFPSQKYMVTTDNLAALTTAGYLNGSNVDSASPVSNTDIIMALYSFNLQTGSGTFGMFTVSIAGASGQITLSEWTGTSGVVLPTIVNHIATYTNTTGTIGEDPATAISGGNIQAGLSGTAGTVASFPATALTGQLQLAAVPSSGNYISKISNASMGQATTFSIPDPGSATSNFMLTNVNNMMGAPNGGITLVKVNGTESGGAVTTANANSGKITTSSLTTPGGSSYTITWTNSLINTNSVILLSGMGGTNTVNDITIDATAGSGTSTITITNDASLGTPLNGTIILGFAVF